MAKTVRIEEIRGCEGNCITINDTRITGPKPWGGGYVIKKWEARVKDIVKALGADVAEVVRCKDCMHSKWYPDDNIRLCNNSNGLFGNVCDGDYCSKGERKDNERKAD